MDKKALLKLIKTGEQIDVELKTSRTDLTKDVYETVCSFNNRDGGHIILGVKNDKTIIGVEKESIDKIKKDFTTTINNGSKIYPPLYIEPEEIEIDLDTTVIHIFVPCGKQVRRLNGRVMDRTYEGDIDISNNEELVYKLYARKQGSFYVNKVFKGRFLDMLDESLIERARKRAVANNKDHEWAGMTNEELLRSAGLILEDIDTQEEGITLAGVLLFGKDNYIVNVLPQYKTDAIFRVQNLDRYDDRDVIITNLLDAFPRLMDFGRKHLNDTFVLDGDVSVSARDAILREIISNILAHRDYSSAYPAKLIIEQDRIFTENSNLAHGHGELQLSKFEPFPKNPAISKVFREIGYADELGSGMRNSYKYTKLYSGGTPVFEEGDIFRTTIPLKEIATKKVGPMDTTGKTTEKTTEKTADLIIRLMRKEPTITINQMATAAGITVDGINYHLRKLREKGAIDRVGGDKGGKWVVLD